MSEYINNSEHRKGLLRHMLLQLHEGTAPEQIKKRLKEILPSIPYNEVVEVEQALIAEDIPVEEIIALCDVHTQVLEGSIDTTKTREIPEGHPVDIFKHENREIEKEIKSLRNLMDNFRHYAISNVSTTVLQMRSVLNNISDIEKHYLKKEYLIFPFLEKHGITGPPKVMWGKHDETRRLLKIARESLVFDGEASVQELALLVDVAIEPALHSIEEMIMKEEKILFPMCMDTFTEEEWYEIYCQISEIGYCLYDPPVSWKPEGLSVKTDDNSQANRIVLSTGSFTVEELESILTTLPIDITFVDKDDKVRYFSNTPDRVFTRNRAILGRDVRLCHPPGSVHVVEQIISDFKSGNKNSAAFWINFRNRFVYIEYFALRCKKGEYLGTLEFTQDATKIRSLQGEQRILNYLES